MSPKPLSDSQLVLLKEIGFTNYKCECIIKKVKESRKNYKKKQPKKKIMMIDSDASEDEYIFDFPDQPIEFAEDCFKPSQNLVDYQEEKNIQFKLGEVLSETEASNQLEEDPRFTLTNRSWKNHDKSVRILRDLLGV